MLNYWDAELDLIRVTASQILVTLLPVQKSPFRDHPAAGGYSVSPVNMDTFVTNERTGRRSGAASDAAGRLRENKSEIVFPKR